MFQMEFVRVLGLACCLLLCGMTFVVPNPCQAAFTANKNRSTLLFRQNMGIIVVRWTRLHAWSMPNPTTLDVLPSSLTAATMFASFPTATWYDEVNPTARATVYHDTPLDFTFMRLGDDWPSMGNGGSSTSKDQPTMMVLGEPKARGGGAGAGGGIGFPNMRNAIRRLLLLGRQRQQSQQSQPQRTRRPQRQQQQPRRPRPTW